MKLKDKKALITGGSRGIGKAVGRAYLEAGANVLLAATSEEELAATKKEFAADFTNVHTHSFDVSDPEGVKLLSTRAMEVLGDIDILVNAAGIYGPIGPSLFVDINHWRRTFDVNIFGTFYMIREVLPHMLKKGYGKIVNFSGGGDGPFPQFSAYNSSKVAVVRLTETLAAEMAGRNIDINSIAPGAVNTHLLEEALATGEALVGKEKYQNFLRQKREGGVPASKAAELCVFLASSASDGLTGKFLSAVWDDWKSWDKKKIEEIMKSDLYTLRRVKATIK